jgi:hypothetical protein
MAAKKPPKKTAKRAAPPKPLAKKKPKARPPVAPPMFGRGAMGGGAGMPGLGGTMGP